MKTIKIFVSDFVATAIGIDDTLSSCHLGNFKQVPTKRKRTTRIEVNREEALALLSALEDAPIMEPNYSGVGFSEEDLRERASIRRTAQAIRRKLPDLGQAQPPKHPDLDSTILEHFEEVRKDLATLWNHKTEDEAHPELGSLESYGLSFEWCAMEEDRRMDPNYKPEPEHWAWLLTCGGPTVEFRFYRNGAVTFFHSWATDRKEMFLRGEDRMAMLATRDYFLEFQSDLQGFND